MNNSKRKLSLKRADILKKKKVLNLLLNLLIAGLGISSLFIKFFLVDGVLAFRAFTVDGNLFTTIVSIVVVIVNVKELATGTEDERKSIYFLQLCSAVTEAIIFIVVMIGYLPIFTDNPAITPYHMFCLHVAIPILAVCRFIFFEKPIGLLKPAKIFMGAIPTGIYGFGVTIAIEIGILPMELVPYSFLDFDSNFVWYMLFALVVIASFGYFWSWIFYRLNIRASVLWYSKDDLEHLERQRVAALSDFDVINSSVLIVFCILSTATLMFSLMMTSNTSTKIQHELASAVSYYMIESYDRTIDEPDSTWSIEDGKLYKGNTLIGDGTKEGQCDELLQNALLDGCIYVKSSELSPEVAKNYDSSDYVQVARTNATDLEVGEAGDILSSEIASSVLESESGTYYHVVKFGKKKYYHYIMNFGSTREEFGNFMSSVYIPVDTFTQQAKTHEITADIMMAIVILLIFGVLYFITNKLTRNLQRSVDYLKELASGNIPKEPLKNGKNSRLSGLTNEINDIRNKLIEDLEEHSDKE